MENLYGFNFSADYSEHSPMACPSPPSTGHHAIPSLWTPQQFLRSDSSSAISDAWPSAVAEVQILDEEEVSKTLRDKITSHPLYPKLVNAYIDCQKLSQVGATPEMVKLLDEIGRESNFLSERSACLTTDLELDNFMVTYCDLLAKYKFDLSRPFDEATTFLKDMEAQLNSLCNGRCRNYNPDKATGSAEEDLSGEEKEADEGKMINEDRELKEKLLRRYGGYIGGLKQEFSKRKKKEMLPKEATQVLHAWWNIHRNWPYPTEEVKIALAEWTGLDQKQINNWFINQRKRHWKPSEETPAAAAAVDGLYGPFCMSD